MDGSTIGRPGPGHLGRLFKPFMDDDDPFGSYGLMDVCISHKPVFDQLFSCCSTRLSDYTFANTFIWREAIHLRWRLIRDCLCVFANGDGGLTLLFWPVGPGNPLAALDEAVAICDAYNAHNHLEHHTRIEYVSADTLSSLPAGAFSVEPMSGDYVYSTAAMIDLTGPELASKRQAKHRFARRYDAHTEPYLVDKHCEQCLDMLVRWHDQASESHEAGGAIAIKRAREVHASQQALRFAPQLGLTGMVLYADGAMVGFTLGEMLDSHTCGIVIEKADRQYAGCAQFIFSEFCRQFWSHTTLCNVGDDWEIPSLAWTKQSYRPLCRLDKYILRPIRTLSVGMHRVSPAMTQARFGGDSPAPFELCSANWGDLDALLALETHNFTKALALSRRQLRYLLKSPSASVHVIRCDSKVVGDALVLRRRHNGVVSARLYSIAIDQAYRGRGLGRALLVNCLDVLRAQGVVSVSLEVDVSNTPAITLYESLGFSRTRMLRDYYGPGKSGLKMRIDLTTACHDACVNSEALGAGV